MVLIQSRRGVYLKWVYSTGRYSWHHDYKIATTLPFFTHITVLKSDMQKVVAKGTPGDTWGPSWASRDSKQSNADVIHRRMT